MSYIFKRIYYEKEVLNYSLGRKIIENYKNLPKVEIKSHNNIEELRKYENKDFPLLKKYLILGIRKTFRFVENKKVSDYLVPFTSTGCSAMCLYCYLVCNFNKCSYLRIFVNVDEILDKILRKNTQSEKGYTFEIGSNSDLILENTITGNLPYIIEKFAAFNKGYITFPTKFDMVNDLLNLKHNKRVIIRVSLNPDYIISHIELGTSSLKNRIIAINKLCDAGYIVGILIAPVILIDNYKEEYLKLFKYMNDNLSGKVKKEVFFEVICMTYSFIHNKINSEAFPKSIKIYDKEKMKGSNRGKYRYKDKYISEAKLYIKELLDKYFKDNEIKYII